jgi:hypothetical protein
MSYKILLASVLLCSGLLTGGDQSAQAAGEVSRTNSIGHTEGESLRGKWKYHAQATCRCADNSCKVITCDGESGVSYEDARFKALLALQFQARAENGRIEGTPTITVRVEY